MEKDRLKQWINNSQCMRFIEMTLLSDIQGLGRLDVELIKESERIKTKSKIKIKTRCKHLTLSKLWIFGAYELVRLMDDMTTKRKDLVSQKAKAEIKKTKIEFEKIRIPLTKLQVPTRQLKEIRERIQKPEKKNRLFAQFADPFISSGDVGWKVYTIIDRRPVEIYYRKDFGNLLLKLFKCISEEMEIKFT